MGYKLTDVAKNIARARAKQYGKLIVPRNGLMLNLEERFAAAAISRLGVTPL